MTRSHSTLEIAMTRPVKVTDLLARGNSVVRAMRELNV